MKISLKVRKAICQCGKENEEVVLLSGKKYILEIVGYFCQQCGRKKLLDLNYIMGIKQNNHLDLTNFARKQESLFN